jgi:hypothetical protein
LALSRQQQKQRLKQIPFGDDKQRTGNSKDNCRSKGGRSRFPSGMTSKEQATAKTTAEAKAEADSLRG